MREVDQKTYDVNYYETDCGGWKEWLNSKGRSIGPRLKYALNVAKIKSGMKVLDFGCGRGELSFQIAELGADVIGMDYAENAIKMAKQTPKPKLGSVKWINNKSLNLNLKNDEFDRILFIDVYEHLYPEQLDKLIPEFYRILKPGGEIIVHTAPNRDFMEIGYPYYTRWANMLFNPLFRFAFGESLITRKNPRLPYDFLVHVNESTLKEVDEMFRAHSFSERNLWYSSKFRIRTKWDRINYLLLQPQIKGLLKWFSYDIWGVMTK